ncbi:dihydrofolate reductase family protein [Lactiplantibacillus pentosus]|uniref:dihydrofolate reductase family protein n=1 Tax=Lactiplantibacillus pentosus TaxID=1589 RepID=UPI00132F973F|nr:dihydrofolate reductase family protein [Lactiplantibacillus pentosus]MBQ0837583.1 dihydrofolate reductase [Lactiplantibacillus pentosus]MBU7464502.1 dihydrofolate reductase [Lactiplantibacillus pentosus]MBU7490232.1 dihydrofolate reductase [Lactiplantibacillus pentosus]MBU7494530.1 dihydrofolate reductase [Lactiplantibacillus pentosus]MBU7520542.1 dihydrofolate reductase [Lactiplantibacillus pentosus]
MRKVVVYIAVSLDGYIADRHQRIDWLGGQDADYQGEYGYSDFIAGVDDVVMGYTTYRQVVDELAPNQWPYAGLTSHVLTHRQETTSDDQIKFVNSSVVDLVATLKSQPGKSIWICGGANVINQLVEQDLVDEYYLTIMPILLGDGVRLFDRHEKSLPLRLVSSSSENGVVTAIYQRR